MSEVIIETDRLNKFYGDFHAVKDVSLKIRRGDIYGFLGPNGAGKSTTIRMLLSLIKPTSGTIRIFGKDLNHSRNEILSCIGSIVEKPDFYKYLSAKTNLEYFAAISGKSIPKGRVDELFELVGLKGREKDKVKGYSHGMKQRLGLAQALVHDPELIILDEPTTGLDPQGIIDIRNLIMYLSKEKGKTVVLSSHLLQEVEMIATRMIIINKGTVAVEGEVNDLLNADELVVSFTVNDTEKCLRLTNESKWKNHFTENEDNVFYFQLNEKEIGELNRFFSLNELLITGIESKKKLENYFLKLTS